MVHVPTSWVFTPAADVVEENAMAARTTDCNERNAMVLAVEVRGSRKAKARMDYSIWGTFL